MKRAHTVLVPGSSRGIGRAIALRLARDGFDLVVHCRHGIEQARAVEAEIAVLGHAARVLAFDVADRAAAAQALEADIAAHGAYYGVVCNAGIVRDAAFPAMTGEEWDSVIHTNLDAFYNEASVNVKSADNTVTALDIASVCALAKEKDTKGYKASLEYLKKNLDYRERYYPYYYEYYMSQALFHGLLM